VNANYSKHSTLWHRHVSLALHLTCNTFIG